MYKVDEDHVLQVPGRDPIQLEEGKKAVSLHRYKVLATYITYQKPLNDSI
mgnify:CR=1 FL=1